MKGKKESAASWLSRAFQGFGKKKKNLRQELLLLLLFGGLLSFLAVSLILCGGFFTIYGAFTNRTLALGSTATDLFVSSAEQQEGRKISEMAESRAKEIEDKLVSIRTTVSRMALLMNGLAAGTVPMDPQDLPDVRRQAVRNGEAYVHYGTRLEREGLSEEIAQQVARDSTVARYISPLMRFYSGMAPALFVASADDYFICVENQPTTETLEFQPEYYELFEPKERPWYKLALAEAGTGRPVFSDVYIGVDDGLPSMSCSAPYYEGDIPAGVVGMGFSLEAISQIVEEATVGSTGFSFVLDQNGNVIMSGRTWGDFAVNDNRFDVRTSSNATLAAAAREMTAGESGLRTVEVNGDEYVLAFYPLKSVGWSYGTLISHEEIISPLHAAQVDIRRELQDFNKSLSAGLRDMLPPAVLVLVFAFVAVVGLSMQRSRHFTQPLYEIGRAVRKIAGGSLEAGLDVRTGDEIEHLARGVNAMTVQMKKHMENLEAITAERERIATELDLAASIQAGMLPAIDPDFKNKEAFGLAAAMYTAKEVGGDFYDFYMLDEKHLAVTIADVSGKGIGAALFMVVAKTILKDAMLSAAAAYGEGKEPDFAAAMAQANNRLCKGNEKNMFVTVFFGALDLASGDFAYVNGGHTSPLLGRAGRFTFLCQKKKNIVLGIMEGVAYQEHRLALSPGDMLFLYTDGVTEAMDERGEMYAEERLQKILDSLAANTEAEDMLAAVREDVAHFVGAAEQSDDITMLGLKI